MTKFKVESPKRHTNTKKFLVSSAALITSERNNQRKSTCIFCRGAHNSGDCKIVNNLNDRKLQLKKLGRCFKCTQRGHLAKFCKNNISFYVCSGSHHSMICEKRFKSLTAPVGSVQESMSERESKVAPRMAANIDTQADKEPMVTVNTHVNSRVQVFLQTAIAQVSKAEVPGKPFVQARVIFDSEAQRSYVSQRLANELELPTISTEKLKISTFGDKNEDVKICNLVELNISNPQNNFRTTLNPFSVPVICRELQSQNLSLAKEQFNHLSNIKFSDECPPGLEMEVDILIGSDYMWTFWMARQNGGNLMNLSLF